MRLTSNLVVANLFIIALWSNELIAAECLNQTIGLSTQAEVDNFQAVYGNGGICDTIRWSLTIEGPDISNLDGLSTIKSIGRKLAISNNGELLDITGLYSLVEVGEHITISENNKLPNLDGLSSLTAVLSLDLYSNDSLENINALSNLTNVQQNLIIGFNALLADLNGLSNLSSVEGLLDIVGNSALTNIDGLSSLNNVASLRIQTNNLLTDIDGLVSLETVGSLTIDSTSLTDLNGLSGITELNSLVILNNPFLVNIHGLSGLSGITGLSIYNNPSLSSLEGLDGITGSGILRVVQNGSLVSLSGLTGLTNISGLEVAGNANLVSIEALANITGPLSTGLAIRANPLLTNIDALSKITAAGVNLIIADNDSLENVDGLVSITNLRGNLEILRNNSLAQLDGLVSLISVGDPILTAGGGVRIWGNPLLRRCTGLIPLFDLIDDGEVGPGSGDSPDVEKFISISNINADCSTIQAILDGEASAELSVSKAYSNNDPTPVDISLECELPTTLISVLNAQASTDSDAVFEVRRFVPGFYSSCSASEEQVPIGYTADNSDCQEVQLTDNGTHYCNITNQQVAVRVVVSKFYADPSPSGDPEVLITLDCPSGALSPGDTILTDGGTATFELVDFNYEGVTCVASELIEPGYIQVDANGCDSLQVEYDTTPSCVFLNAIDPEVIFVDGYEE